MIDRFIKKYLDQKFSSNSEKPSSELPRFYKLPYIGEYSNHVGKRISKLVSKYCTEDTNIKLIFTPFKISSCFSLKDKPIKIRRRV